MIKAINGHSKNCRFFGQVVNFVTVSVRWVAPVACLEATGVARNKKLPAQPTSLRIQPMGFNLFPASTKLKALILRILKKSSQIVVFVV